MENNIILLDLLQIYCIIKSFNKITTFKQNLLHLNLKILSKLSIKKVSMIFFKKRAKHS